MAQEPVTFELPPAQVNIQAATSGRRFQIEDYSGRVVLAQCDDQCTLELPPGRYTLTIPESEGSARGVRRFAVSGRGSYTLKDADQGSATAGLVAGITGILLAPTGLVLLAAGGAICVDGCDGNPRIGSLGLLALLGSAVLTPTGFIMFNAYKRPELEKHDWNVGFGVTPDGQLGFRGVF